MPLSIENWDRERQKIDNHRYALEAKYDTVRENIEEQLKDISELLNPFYKMDYKAKLDVFAMRLHEIAEMAEELAKEFE